MEILKLRKKSIERRKLRLKNECELKTLKEDDSDDIKSSLKKLEISNTDEPAPRKNKGINLSQDKLVSSIPNGPKAMYPSQAVEKEIEDIEMCKRISRAGSTSSVELKNETETVLKNEECKPPTSKTPTIPRIVITSKFPDGEYQTGENQSTARSLNPPESTSLNFLNNVQTKPQFPNEKSNEILNSPPKTKTNLFHTLSAETPSKIQKEYEKRAKAATLIQAMFRGYIARKFFNLLKLRAKNCQLRHQKSIEGKSYAQDNIQTKSYNDESRNFNKINSNPLVNKSSSSVSKNILSEAFSGRKRSVLSNKNLLGGNQRNYLEEGSLFFENKESVLVFGGVDPHKPYGSEHNTGKDAYRYHPETNFWEFVTELPEPRHHHSVAFLKGRIYVLGGADPRESDAKTRSKIVPTVWSFEPITRAWFTETSMKIARKNFGLVSMNSKLYVIGGQDKYQRILSNVERFDPLTGKWDEIAPLEIGRMGVAVAKYRDVIWVCGGMTCAKKSILSQRVDCYDTQRNVWIQCVPLRFPRCFGVLFPMNDKLYLIGGAGRQSDKEKSTYSVGAIDSWNLQRKEWSFECELSIPRHGHSACYLGSQILILGGVTTIHMCALSKVECWCSQRSTWIHEIADLPAALSGHGSVTLPPASLM